LAAQCLNLVKHRGWAKIRQTLFDSAEQPLREQVFSKDIWRIAMKTVRLLTAALLALSALAAAASNADARTHIRVYRTAMLGISYKHNYGPGPFPGTFAYYDGPTSAYCAQSAATYRGQDGRRHPCN